VARVPANTAAGADTLPVPPIADSRSQTSVWVTRPIPAMFIHIPARMSPACRDGITVAVKNWENPANQRSHCVICPGA